MFLPIVPQVPFAIIAAYCFSRGSPKMHKWILNHKQLGPPVKDWEEHKVVRPKLKAFSTVAMVVGASLAWYKFHEKTPWMAYTMVGIFLVCIVFVLTRKSKPSG